MGRARNGQAISTERASRQELRALKKLQREAKRDGDLPTWRRATAVLGYLAGVSVIEQAAQLDVTRGSVNRWLQWFEAAGTDGLRPRERPGGAARLTEAQHRVLIAAIEAGPLAAGYPSGLWTGPMVGELIRRRFGVSYHNHYIPRLLHQLGFSVQRPRKRLAKADAERQAVWLKQTFPAIKKSRCVPRGSPVRRRSELLARRHIAPHVVASRLPTARRHVWRAQDRSSVCGG